MDWGWVSTEGQRKGIKRQNGDVCFVSSETNTGQLIWGKQKRQKGAKEQNHPFEERKIVLWLGCIPPQCVALSRSGVFTDVIKLKMSSGGWALIQCDWSVYKKGILPRDRHSHRKNVMWTGSQTLEWEPKEPLRLSTTPQELKARCGADSGRKTALLPPWAQPSHRTGTVDFCCVR